MKEYLQTASKERIMRQAVEHGEFVLASGVRAAQKFDIDRLADGSDELYLAVNGLVACIEDNFRNMPMRYRHRYLFDAIGSVASGATRLGTLVASRLDMPHIQTVKNDEGEFEVSSDSSTDDVYRMLLLDDVYTSGTNLGKVIEAIPPRVAIIGAVALLDRSGIPDPRLPSGAPVVSVIQERLE